MSLSPHLDISASMATVIGTANGLDRNQLLKCIAPVATAHAAIKSAGDDAWPHVVALGVDLGAARALAEQLAGQRLAIIAEPAVARAVVALSASQPAAPTPVLITSPDPAQLRGLAGHKVLAVRGPVWVETLVAAMPELDIALLDAIDARFGLWSPLSLALCALSGVDLDALVAHSADTAKRCASQGLYDNPAYMLCAAILAMRAHAVDQLALVVPTARLLPWARHAAAAINLLTCRAGDRAGLREHNGVPCHVFEAGDSAALQRLVDGPGDVLTLALWCEEAGGDLLLTEATSAWSLTRALFFDWLGQLSSVGRPAVQLRLASLDPVRLSGASYLMIHAAIATALALTLDPLSTPAVERWLAGQRAAQN